MTSSFGSHHALAALAALVTLAAPAATQGASEWLGVGDQVPALNCEDVTGDVLTWDLWQGRAVIVYFHSSNAGYSLRGLRDLLSEVGSDERLEETLGLLVVVRGGDDSGVVAEELADCQLLAKVTTNASAECLAFYRAVAFPSAYCLDAERRIVHAVKGYGLRFASKLHSAALLAARQIDRPTFEAQLAGDRGPLPAVASAQSDRTLRLARILFFTGKAEEARDALEPALTIDSENIEAVALLARIQLALGGIVPARPWIDRVAELGPGSTESRHLRAEQALLEGQPQAALMELSTLEDSHMGTALLKGEALEQLGRLEDAAALYRKAMLAGLAEREAAT